MNVLIIPEDFRKDQFILKPLFLGLFRAIGKPHAHIEICKKPLLGGIGEAMKSERVAEVVEEHKGMTDIFILCVDRDGDTNRRQRLDSLEREFGTGQTFFAENAWEELETWLLAGVDLPEDWRWQNVRAEVSVKEKYFNPLAMQRNVVDTPGEGREVLGKEAACNIRAIRQKCPEDFNALAQRLTTFINT